MDGCSFKIKVERAKTVTLCLGNPEMTIFIFNYHFRNLWRGCHATDAIFSERMLPISLKDYGTKVLFLVRGFALWCTRDWFDDLSLPARQNMTKLRLAKPPNCFFCLNPDRSYILSLVFNITLIASPRDTTQFST